MRENFKVSELGTDQVRNCEPDALKILREDRNQ